MKFYFCEKCGKRITEQDIQRGEGRDKKLKGVYCTDCAAGVMTMESLPLSNAEAREILTRSGPRRPAAPPPRPPRPPRPQRRNTGRLPAVTKSKRTTSPPAPGSPSARSAAPRSRAPDSQANTMLYGALLLGLGVVVLSAAFLVTSGHGDPPTHRKAARKKTARAAPARTLLEKKPSVRDPAPAAPHPVSAPLATGPAPPRTPVESPRERYERRLREGKVKRPPPAASSPPPAAVAAVVEKPRLYLAEFPYESSANFKRDFSRIGRPPAWMDIKNEKCIYMSANPDPRPASITWRLPGSYQRFRAEVCNRHRYSRAVWFSVWGDGKELWKSSKMSGRTKRVPCEVDISGVKELTLKTHCQNEKDAHTTWIDPQIIKATTTPVPPPVPPPAPPNPPAAVWQPIFDGKTLQGWKAAKGKWRVRKGEIEGDSRKTKSGARLDSTASYADFELSGEFRFLRAGYADLRLRTDDATLELKARPGSWHTFHVIARGKEVRATLDGKAKALKKNKGQRVSGQLKFFTNDGGRLRLKNLKIRRLPPAAPPGALSPGAEKWKNLFNGKDLSGWKQAKGRWRVADGVVIGDSSASPTGQVRLDSLASYADFELKGKYRNRVRRYHEIFVRGSGVLIDIISATGVWHDFHVMARGDEVSASVDGKPVRVHIKNPEKKSGNLSFYQNLKGVLELKDLRLRVLAPPNAPSPGAGTWEQLFNGKDLSGWKVTHGRWRIQKDGVLTKVADAGRSRLETEKQFGDFELRAKLRLVGPQSRIAEIQIRSYGWVFGFGYQKGQWQDLRIIARGPSVRATLDGRPLQTEPDSKQQARSGWIAFYANKNWGLQVKELRLRKLAP